MKSYRKESALEILERTLSERRKEHARKKFSCKIPALWSTPSGTAKMVAVDPFGYYLKTVRKVKRAKPRRRPRPTGGEWSRDAVIYSAFVRTTAAVDHDGNGKLDLPVNSQGFRETGTFLKMIAMLPYIKSLGANTLHLLPITAIGHDGNKGTLGSPYAIRNPYELDENLAEPLLDLDARTEFHALVEAAHRMGLRVVVEFVFRTSAKDGDWVKEHPEWMYWIKDSVQPRKAHETDEGKYGSPLFNKEELAQIHRDVNENRMDQLLPPHEEYRAFFTPPPTAENVTKDNGRYLGTLPDGTRVRIPGAFADWPPDDNQPPWNDVTYLRMYDNPEFNYIGYNTIRMYDARLARPEYVNKPLWERIIGIIPYYQREFGIDGVLIDMGHALPKELKADMIRTARAVDPDFAFWDENFAVTEKSKEEGYNAVLGYVWHEQHLPERMKALCDRLAHEHLPLPFFATTETHNTHRAAARPGGMTYARWTLVFNMFLPAIPYIHSGYELGEEYPINTGLDFTHKELTALPSEQLPLFSEYAYDWARRTNMVEFMQKVLRLREKYHSLVIDPDPASFVCMKDENPHVLAYARISRRAKIRLAVVGNSNMNGAETTALSFDTSKRQVVDLLTGKRLALKEGRLHTKLKPGQSVVFEV